MDFIEYILFLNEIILVGNSTNKVWLGADEVRKYSTTLFSGCVILFCLIMVLINIQSSIEQYRQAFTVTVLKSEFVHISNVPFPGVAICNTNHIKTSALLKMAHRMKDKANLSLERTYDTLTFFKDFIKIPSKVPTTPKLKKMKLQLEHILVSNHQEYNLSGLTTELAHSCEDMLKTCMFKNKVISCRELFVERLLISGKSCCISKNSIIAENSPDPKPWYVYQSGSSAGLFIILDLETGEYHHRQLKYRSFGAEVYIFDPNTHPFRMKFGGSSTTLLGDKQVTLIHMNPVIENNTFQGESNYRDSCRRTLYTAAGQRQSYNFYECMYQCVVQDQTDECKCYPFAERDGMDRECSIRGLECITKHLRRSIKTGDQITQELNLINYYINKCNCHTACESVLYQLSPSSFFAGKNSPEANQTHLKVFFESSSVTMFEKQPVYDFYNLLVGIIGHSSLFLGISLISVVELIYFATLRLLCDLYTNHKSRKDEMEPRRLDHEEIFEGTAEGKIYWSEILASID